jgi:hypothetical protein
LEAEAMGKLKTKQVENAGPGQHADGDGLYLQVTSDDARSWLYRYKLNGTSSTAKKNTWG